MPISSNMSNISKNVLLSMKLCLSLWTDTILRHQTQKWNFVNRLGWSIKQNSVALESSVCGSSYKRLISSLATCWMLLWCCSKQETGQLSSVYDETSSSLSQCWYFIGVCLAVWRKQTLPNTFCPQQWIISPLSIFIFLTTLGLDICFLVLFSALAWEPCLT